MKFGYTIIYVENVKETLAFYQKAFGLETRFMHESGMYAELETGETVLAFAALEVGKMNFADDYLPVSQSEKPFGIEIAFVCDEVEAAFAKAVAAGAKAFKQPETKPWGQTVAYVIAAEGTLVELCTPVNG